MKTMSAAVLGFGLIGFAFPADGWGAEPCPVELTQAKAELKSALTTAKSEDVQAPRSLAGARSQEVQAPRAQEVQAPRAQEIQAPRAQEVQAPRAQEVQAPRAQEVQAPRAQEAQAPRAQEVQAPRAQEVQAPRSHDVQAPRIDQASKLISESDAACEKGDMTLAAQKAREALSLLK